jgi:hypothetical protein
MSVYTQEWRAVIHIRPRLGHNLDTTIATVGDP